MRPTLAFSCSLLLAIAASTNAFAPPTNHQRFVQQNSRSNFNSVNYFDHARSNFQTPSSSSRTSALKMVSPGITIAAITSAMAGGFFSGGLHAIAGPDHLAALLPRCVGQRWFRAGKVGAVWGIGHGVSATLLGVVAFALKNRLQNNMGPRLQTLLSGATSATELAVGVSIVLIGLMGMKEAREWEEEVVDGPQPQSLSSAVADTGVKQTRKRAIFFNGLLHGFSWDGAPSLAPALAVATWSGNLAFLSAYAAGTMGTMAIATTLIGEGTRRAGEIFQRPDLPQKLSLASSFVALAVGLFWCYLALS